MGKILKSSLEFSFRRNWPFCVLSQNCSKTLVLDKLNLKICKKIGKNLIETKFDFKIEEAFLYISVETLSNFRVF